MTQPPLLDRVDAAAALGSLRARQVNYRPEDVDESWHFDVQRTSLPAERPGPPEPDGVFQTACRLAAAYEFADPAVLRAVYPTGSDLLGRDMLLEGRFFGLRFYMGVRVTAVVDEERIGAHGGLELVWGWAYQTLGGHLEQGRMLYEVVKRPDTGEVAFELRAWSRGAPSLGPVTSLGWALFGRSTQLRFYRASGSRLARAVVAGRGAADPVPPRRTRDGLVLAPSDARARWVDRFTVRRDQPS